MMIMMKISMEAVTHLVSLEVTYDTGRVSVDVCDVRSPISKDGEWVRGGYGPAVIEVHCYCGGHGWHVQRVDQPGALRDTHTYT